MRGLKGKVAIVTGGLGDLGAAGFPRWHCREQAEFCCCADDGTGRDWWGLRA